MAPTHLATATAEGLASAALQLAEAFAREASLWVVAPGLEDHARHVAVEFVHPSSVGARSLSAVAVTSEGPALASELRRRARPGDVLLTLGDASTAIVHELAARCQAWGLLHLHLGWGIGPAGTTSVTIGPDAAAEPLLTRSYHVLWELVSVALGRPRPTTAPDATVAASSCTVCADELVVAEVREIDASSAAAVVATACGPMSVDVSLVDDLCTYDLVLLQAGVAVSRMTLP